MILSATQVARIYRKRFNAVEAWKEIRAEREALEAPTIHTDKIKISEIYRSRLAEGMYVIPAYHDPHHLIVTASEQLQVMDWGLIPHGVNEAAKDRYINKNFHKNARAEDIFDKWPWKNLIRRRRCIMPSTGYYEYHHYSDKKTQPFFIFPTDRKVFSFGGLWDEWQNPVTGDILHTFVQITTAANPLTRKIHNGGNNPFRMPFILPQHHEQRWLDPLLTDDEIRELLRIYPPHHMAAYPVNPHFKDLLPYDKRAIKNK